MNTSHWTEKLEALSSHKIEAIGTDNIRQVLLKKGSETHDVAEIQVGPKLGSAYRKVTYRASKESRPKLVAWCYAHSVKIAARVGRQNIPIGQDCKLVRDPVARGRTCNVKGCANTTENGSGLCEEHAGTWKKRTELSAVCNVAGCSNSRAAGSGLCEEHTEKLVQKGVKVRPGAPETPAPSKDTPARCTATTQSGKRCRNSATNGTTLCHIHGKDGADIDVASLGDTHNELPAELDL